MVPRCSLSSASTWCTAATSAKCLPPLRPRPLITARRAAVAPGPSPALHPRCQLTPWLASSSTTVGPCAVCTATSHAPPRPPTDHRWCATPAGASVPLGSTLPMNCGPPAAASTNSPSTTAIQHFLQPRPSDKPNAALVIHRPPAGTTCCSLIPRPCSLLPVPGVCRKRRH